MKSTSSKSGCIEGSGNSTTVKRQMASFTKVNILGNYTVTLTQDSSYLVSITADDNLMQYIATNVSNGTLSISTTDNLCGSDSISITIGVGTLTSLQVAGQDTVSGTLTAETISIQSSGHDTITLSLTATSVNSNISGQSTFNLTGSATSHSINVSGQGTLNALGFPVQSFTTQTSGSGTYQVNVSTTMTLHTTGKSVVKYEGNPTITNDNKGSSTVTKIS